MGLKGLRVIRSQEQNLSLARSNSFPLRDKTKKKKFYPKRFDVELME